MRLHFHFSLSCIGEGNGNPLQCSCLENPRDRGAWWAAVYGVAQSWPWLKRLSSSEETSKLVNILESLGPLTITDAWVSPPGILSPHVAGLAIGGHWDFGSPSMGADTQTWLRLLPSGPMSLLLGFIFPPLSHSWHCCCSFFPQDQTSRTTYKWNKLIDITVLWGAKKKCAKTIGLIQKQTSRTMSHL